MSCDCIFAVLGRKVRDTLFGKGPSLGCTHEVVQRICFKSNLLLNYIHVYFIRIISHDIVRVMIKVKGHQHWPLANRYDLEIGHFYKWIAWWLAGGCGFFA